MPRVRPLTREEVPAELRAILEQSERAFGARLVPTGIQAQLVELVATAAMENYRARFNHAFGVESQHFYDDRRARGSQT